MNKKATAFLFVVMAIVIPMLALSCASRGAIQVDAIETLVEKVSERHDQYVTADPNLSEGDKADFLRSTDLLRKVIEAAKASATPTSEKE